MSISNRPLDTRTEYATFYRRARTCHTSPRHAAIRWALSYSHRAKYWRAVRRAALRSYIASGVELTGWVNVDRRARWERR